MATYEIGQPHADGPTVEGIVRRIVREELAAALDTPGVTDRLVDLVERRLTVTMKVVRIGQPADGPAGT